LASLHYPPFSAWSAFSLYKQKARKLLLINVSIAGVTIATTYRKVPFDAKPALRAQRLNPVDIGGDAFGVLYILQKDGKILLLTRRLEA